MMQDFMWCRMAAANVDGVAGAVTALSREVARSQASVKELHSNLQDMRCVACRAQSSSSSSSVQALQLACNSDTAQAVTDPSCEVARLQASVKGLHSDLQDMRYAL